MRIIDANERIKKLVAENAALKASNDKNRADVDYVAMMADIDIPTEESEEAQ